MTGPRAKAWLEALQVWGFARALFAQTLQPNRVCFRAKRVWVVWVLGFRVVVFGLGSTTQGCMVVGI